MLSRRLEGLNRRYVLEDNNLWVIDFSSLERNEQRFPLTVNQCAHRAS
jgi:hypothetical protein